MHEALPFMTGISDFMKPVLAPTEANSSKELEHQVAIESLGILFRCSPITALCHVVPASLIFYGFSPVIGFQILLYWWLSIITTSGAILVLCFGFSRQHPDADFDLERSIFRSRLLNVFMLIQIGLWGTAAVLLWPLDIAHRALLVIVLAGIISVGGIMFSLQGKSSWIYCLPVAIPTVYMLLSTGSRLEYIMAAMIAFYSLLLPVVFNILSRVFRDGIQSRFRLQALTITDPLTRLANRRGFDQFFENVWQQSIRTLQSISILIIDVDQFKSYNDQYGHPGGDRALQQLAGILRAAASRSTDLCARVGGEEFVVLMAATGERGSRLVAKEIQENLHRENIIHKANNTGRLTVSIGINTLVPDQNSSIEEFFEAADRALYSAKLLGQNHIEANRTSVTK